MKRTHLPGIARWPSVVQVAAAAALAAGLSLSSPAASVATAAPGLAAAGNSGAFSPGRSHGTGCGKTCTGQLGDCPKPLSSSQLPAGAKDSAVVTRPVSDIASLVDTRTWTSGGGDTLPGPGGPFGPGAG